MLDVLTRELPAVTECLSGVDSIGALLGREVPSARNQTKSFFW